MTDESTRLEALTQAPETMEYLDTTDKDFPEIRWTIFGAPNTDEIIVRAQVHGKSFYMAGASPLLYPSMIDRIFGIDIDDHALASSLSNQLWERDGAEMRAILASKGPRN
jgi:hypothetical protein